MTLVDPFVPVKNTSKARALPGLTNNIPRPVQPSMANPDTRPATPRPIMRSTPVQKQAVRAPVAHRPAALPEHNAHVRKATPVVRHTAAPHTAPKPKARRFARGRTQLKLLLAGAAILGAGLMLQSLIFGQLIIVGYALYAFIRHIPSYTTLTLAGILIVGVIVLMAFNQFSPLINTFSIYAFLLITTGIVCLIREIYGQNKEAGPA